MQIGIGLGISHLRANGGGVAPAATAPSAMTAGQWTLTDSPSAGGDKLSLNITALPYDGGSALTALQYRVGGGSAQTLSGLATGARLITVLASTAAAVEVRAVNAIGSAAWSDVKTVTPTVTAVAVPVNTTLPTISGTPTQGQTLAALTGIWSNSPSSYSYQWYRNGVSISGATASTYLLLLADVAANITVAVIAYNAGGAGAAATSAATAAIAASTVTPADYVVTTDAEYAAVMANSAATLNGKILEFSGSNFTSISVNGKDFATGFTMRCAAGGSVPNMTISSTVSNLTFDGMNFKMKGWPATYAALVNFTTCVVNKIVFRNCVFEHGYGSSLVPFSRTTQYPEYTRIDHNLTATTTSTTTALTWQDPAMTLAHVYFFNNGTNPVYVKLGGVGVVATTADTLVAVGSAYEKASSVNPTTDTHVAILSTGGTSALNARTEIGMSKYLADCFGSFSSSAITDITIENCTFQNLNNGIKGTGKPTGTQIVRNNTLKNIYQDVIAISAQGTAKTYVINNFAETGFARSGIAQDLFGDAADPHGDAIQMFGNSTGTGTYSVKDVILAGNVFYKAAVRSGQQNQGAFISDNNYTPSYNGVYVIANTFLGGATNGVNIGEGSTPAENVYTYGNIIANQDDLAAGVSSMRLNINSNSHAYDSRNVMQARTANTGIIESDTSLIINTAASTSALFPNWANLPTATTRAEVEAALAVGAEATGLGYVAAKSKLNFAATDPALFVDWNNLPSGVEWTDLVSQPTSALVTLPLRKVLNQRASQTVSVSAGTEWRSVATDGTTEVQAWTTTSGTIATGQYIQIRGTTTSVSLGTTTLGVTINGFLQQTVLTNVLVTPSLYHTQTGTGPYFRDPANATPASTTRMEWKTSIYPTSRPSGTVKLFAQESTGCDLETIASGILRMTIEDGSGTDVTSGLSTATTETLTLNQWQEISVIVDHTLGTAVIKKNGTTIGTITWTPTASPAFQTGREISFFGTSSGGNLMPSGWQVEYGECYFTTSGVRSLRKRVEGNAATVNADGWKGGTNAT